MTDLNQFIGNWGLEQAAKLNHAIRYEKPFIVRDIGVDNRTMNHWEKWGLYEVERENQQTWRRFSFHDLIWIRMVHQFREFGVPVKLILQARETLTRGTPVEVLLKNFRENEELASHLHQRAKQDANDKDRKSLDQFRENPEVAEFWRDKSLTLLQVLIVEAITKRIPVTVALFQDGTALPLIHFQPFPPEPEFLRKLAFEPHVVVSLNGLIRDFLHSDYSLKHLPRLHLLTEEETKLLHLIQSGDYDAIRIKFKNRRMKALELEKNEDTRRRIVDVLAEHPFQDILIRKHDGKVSSFVNIRKIKFG